MHDVGQCSNKYIERNSRWFYFKSMKWNLFVENQIGFYFIFL